jgi:excisionase family DNA binding protein
MNDSGKKKAEGAVLLPAERVAEMLQVSTRTLWRLQNAGRLIGPVRLGRSVRWRKDELLRWIAAGCPACSDWQEGER